MGCKSWHVILEWFKFRNCKHFIYSIGSKSIIFDAQDAFNFINWIQPPAAATTSPTPAATTSPTPAATTSPMPAATTSPMPAATTSPTTAALYCSRLGRSQSGHRRFSHLFERDEFLLKVYFFSSHDLHVTELSKTYLLGRHQFFAVYLLWN